MGYVIFAKVKQTNTTAYPGVLGVTWYGKITEFLLNPMASPGYRPPISTLRSGTNLVLSWPISSSFVLQTNASLGSTAAWQTVSSGLATNGSNVVYTNTMKGASGYFRLLKQP